jgi:hypothetical protein
MGLTKGGSRKTDIALAPVALASLFGQCASRARWLPDHCIHVVVALAPADFARRLPQRCAQLSAAG